MASLNDVVTSNNSIIQENLGKIHEKIAKIKQSLIEGEEDEYENFYNRINFYFSNIVAELKLTYVENIKVYQKREEESKQRINDMENSLKQCKKLLEQEVLKEKTLNEKIKKMEDELQYKRDCIKKKEMREQEMERKIDALNNDVLELLMSNMLAKIEIESLEESKMVDISQYIDVDKNSGFSQPLSSHEKENNFSIKQLLIHSNNKNSCKKLYLNNNNDENKSRNKSNNIPEENQPSFYKTDVNNAPFGLNFNFNRISSIQDKLSQISKTKDLKLNIVKKDVQSQGYDIKIRSSSKESKENNNQEGHINNYGGKNLNQNIFSTFGKGSQYLKNVNTNYNNFLTNANEINLITDHNLGNHYKSFTDIATYGTGKMVYNDARKNKSEYSQAININEGGDILRTSNNNHNNNSRQNLNPNSNKPKIEASLTSLTGSKSHSQSKTKNEGGGVKTKPISLQKDHQSGISCDLKSTKVVVQNIMYDTISKALKYMPNANANNCDKDTHDIGNCIKQNFLIKGTKGIQNYSDDFEKYKSQLMGKLTVNTTKCKNIGGGGGSNNNISNANNHSSNLNIRQAQSSNFFLNNKNIVSKKK